MDVTSLVQQIDSRELLTVAPPLMAWKIDAVDNEDAVAQFMYRGGPLSPQANVGVSPDEDVRPDRSYWEAVKNEMHTFLCTNDPRYRELWKRIDTLEKKSTTTIVGVIAAFLGASIGAAATLLAGFVAVCLYGIAKVGKEAYCKYAA